MPASVPALKTVAKPNLKNQPPYAAVFTNAKPLHMVVNLCLEIVLLSQGMKKPGFETGDVAAFAWFSSACTNLGWKGMYNLKNVYLPEKRILDEIADKQKAVPEEADLVPLGDYF